MMIWAEICTWMDGLKVGKISRHLFEIARRMWWWYKVFGCYNDHWYEAHCVFEYLKEVGSFLSRCMRSTFSPLADKSYREVNCTQSLPFVGLKSARHGISKVIQHWTHPRGHFCISYYVLDVPKGVDSPKFDQGPRIRAKRFGLAL